MKFYFAAAEGGYKKILLQCKVQNILESAYYLKYSEKPNELNFKNHLLDSGGFTLIKNNKTIDVESYARYINHYKIKVAFNLDVISVETTLKNQEYLNKHTNCYIIPVYHYSDFNNRKNRNLIKQYAKQYPYISIAGMGCKEIDERNKFYEHCFSVCKDDVKIHGLASTAIDIMDRFPFYSVDSSSWLNAVRFGNYMEFKKNKIIKHKSLRLISRNKEKNIGNINQINASNEELFISNIESYLNFENYITNLWKERGVIHEDFTR